MDKLYIVMPAYNEEENIQQTIKEWCPIIDSLGNGSKLLIINDGSKDSTFEKASSLQGKYKNLEVINKQNSGHGPTCLYGYQLAVDAGADWVFQTDSDGQTKPEEFWQFWENRDKFDFIIGSRSSRQDGFSRIIVTKVLKMVLLYSFGVVIKDANTPFRLMKSKYLKLYLSKIPMDFFLANVLLSVLIVKKAEKIKWIDITFRPRQGGENSINISRIIRIGIKALKEFKEFRNKNVEIFNF